MTLASDDYFLYPFVASPMIHDCEIMIHDEYSCFRIAIKSKYETGDCQISFTLWLC